MKPSDFGPKKFWRFVKEGGPEDCWLWTGPKSNGYPVIFLRKILVKPRSLEKLYTRAQPSQNALLTAYNNSRCGHTWEIANPKYHRIERVCENRFCFRPDHMVRCDNGVAEPSYRPDKERILHDLAVINMCLDIELLDYIARTSPGEVSDDPSICGGGGGIAAGCRLYEVPSVHGDRDRSRRAV